jgi:response regulator RpfG family c-di-GMP phosphodiesterase
MKQVPNSAILLVDDEEYMLTQYREIFTGLPFTLYTLKESQVEIDLVVTNIKMPLVDGIEMLQILHQKIDYSLNALIITAMYTDEFKVKLMNYIYPQVQLVDVLYKPLDYVPFFHAVNNALDPKKLLV